MHRLSLLAVAALTALALMTGVASAQIEIHDEGKSGARCSDVNVVKVHRVTGGCRIQFESSTLMPMFAYVPAKVLLSACDLHFTVRIDGAGEGYATDQLFTGKEPAPAGPCSRVACDEDEAAWQDPHKELLWAFHVNEAAGAESVTSTFCFRTGSPEGSREGGDQFLCTLHFPFVDAGEHNYEIGGLTKAGLFPATEQFCESDLGVSIEPHIFNEAPSWDSGTDIEIVH